MATDRVISHEEFLSGLSTSETESDLTDRVISHEEFMGMDVPEQDAPPEIIESFNPVYNRVLDYANRVAHIAFPQLTSGTETDQTAQDKKTVGSGTLGAIGSLVGTPATVEAVFGIDTPVGRVSQKAGDYINKLAGEISPNDPDFFDSVLSGAGSSLAFLAPGKGVQYGLQAIPKSATLLTRMAPAIGAGVMTVLEASSEATGVFNDMRRRGETLDDSAHSALKNFSLNTGLIGITNAFGVGSKEVNVAKKIFKSAPLESLQEWWQSVFEDISKDDPIDYAKANTAGGSGLIIGAGAGAVTSVIEKDILAKALDKFPGASITKEEMALVEESMQPTKTVVTEEPAGDEIVNNTPPLVETPSKPSSSVTEQPKSLLEQIEQADPEQLFHLKPDIAALVKGVKVELTDPSVVAPDEEVEGAIEPDYRKTIQQFVVGEVDEQGRTLKAEDLDVENLIVEGRPRQEIMDRAKEISSKANESYFDASATKEQIIRDIGKFQIDKGNRDIAEEIKGLPKDLRAKKGEGKPFDVFAQEVAAKFLGPNADRNDVMEYLKKLDVKRQPINRFIPDARRQVIEEMQGKTFTRVTPGIKKTIREQTGQVQPAEDPTITESEALKAQMQIAEKSSKEGFREGKRVAASTIKSAKQIIERRRMLVRSIRDSLHLSDSDMRKVSGKDIRLMDNYEFKKFVDDLEFRAMELAQTREDKVAVLSTLSEMNFKKVDNLRKSLNLPSIRDMNSEQLQQFNDAMEQFQAEDQFLSTRVLETLDNTELAGAKTIREVREIYAEKTGQNIEDVDTIDVGELDKVRYDTALARQNPFYKLMVDTVNSATLEGADNYLEIDKNIDEIFEKARKSRKRTITEKLIPSDKRIMDYVEAGIDEKLAIAKEMTPEELNAAAYVMGHWNSAEDYLIQQGVMEKGLSDYATHTRRSFLEAFKEDGIISAFKEILKQQEEDKSVFQIIGSDTDTILPHEKHFRFAMHRSGEMQPSSNLAKAFKTYMRAFYTKKAIDRINPVMMAYAQSLSKHDRTLRGLEMDRRLINFVKEYLNNKQGRRSDVGFINQGGKIDRTLRLMDAFVTLRDLGFNLISGLANQVGDQLGNLTALSPGKVALGVYRMRTAKGQRIIEANRDFVGKSPWKDLSDTAGDIGSTFYKSLFLLLGTASVQANKQYLLASLTKEEWANGEISFERKAELLREMGEYRVVHGSRSIIGSTSAAKFFTKYLTWAIPVATTTIHNINEVQKMVREGDPATVIKSKEFNQLFRQAIISSFVLFSARAMMEELDDDDSFLGALARRSVSEALSLIAALDPRLFIGQRMLAFLKSLSIAVASIPIAGYQYAIDDDEELEKTVEKFKRETGRIVIPSAIKQFIPKDE